ncbi:hypothetical protein [Saccharothrix australiensis]|uniref:Uncharacterized protein n=1 Tax=Saccharothrix australiensis TaxID=2072 RepID=A0A495W6B8_9PSEU|nr:hypothetical protein [Saccharothrix australiensis]RKT56203.1 hypothetical protein C8E97_4892 [Saccharothrix australiensis]
MSTSPQDPLGRARRAGRRAAPRDARRAPYPEARRESTPEGRRGSSRDVRDGAGEPPRGRHRDDARRSSRACPDDLREPPGGAHRDDVRWSSRAYLDDLWEPPRGAHRGTPREPTGGAYGGDLREPPRDGRPDPRRDGRREPARAPARRTGPPPRRRRRLLTPGRALLCLVLSLVTTAVVKAVQPTTAPLATAGLAVALAAVPLVADLLHGSAEARARGAAPGSPAVAACVLLGIGGGAAYGTAATADRLTAHESVVAERLAAPVAGRLGPLVATVEQVAVTANFTKVTVSVVNRSSATAKVSVVGSCRLVGQGGVELRLDGLFDALRERFFLDVPGGGAVVRRTVAFPGVLPAGEMVAALGCGSVSWSGSDPTWSTRDLVGRPLRVADLKLTAVP